MSLKGLHEVGEGHGRFGHRGYVRTFSLDQGSKVLDGILSGSSGGRCVGALEVEVIERKLIFKPLPPPSAVLHP